MIKMMIMVSYLFEGDSVWVWSVDGSSWWLHWRAARSVDNRYDLFGRRSSNLLWLSLLRELGFGAGRPHIYSYSSSSSSSTTTIVLLQQQQQLDRLGAGHPIWDDVVDAELILLLLCLCTLHTEEEEEIAESEAAKGENTFQGFFCRLMTFFVGWWGRYHLFTDHM